MSNSEGFEKLKSIGAQKIHEKTHIAKYHVQSLLHNNFDEMTKIQFLGFVSILEREYGVHLDDLRERGLHHFASARISEADGRVFLQAQKNKSNGALYTVLLVVFIGIGMFYFFTKSVEEPALSFSAQDNTTIQTVKEEILQIPSDANVSESNFVENNQTAIEVVEEVTPPVLKLKIKPHAKLWIGYIDLATHKKSQITTAKTIELDPTKEWLLSLGHGDISVDVHGTVQKYNSANNIRFLYREGTLQELSFKEFKELNKGAVW